MSLRFCFWYHSANTIVTFVLINRSYMKEIEAFYSQGKGAIVHVQDMDEFHSIDDDDVTRAAPAAPVQGDVLA